jgi:hypothetical protein
MKIDSLVRLLVVMKKTIPAVLLLGSVGLGLAPTAKAQLTFTLDTFTTDTLAITIDGASLLSGTTPTNGKNFLSLINADDLTGVSWSVAVSSSSYSAASLGSSSIAFAYLYNSSNPEFGGDVAIIQGSEPYISGSSFGSDFTVTWSGSGAFDLNGVTNFALIWGSVDYAHYEIQSVVAVNAVPEPSTYAAIIGAIALFGAVAVRRRTKQT